MNLQKVLEHYIECALWSSSDPDGGAEYLDQTDATLSDAAKREMAADCQDFLEANEDDLDRFSEFGFAEPQIGHDFWLTRNGHGAGFWDRGAGDVGERLTEAAKAHGSCDLYIGGDGKIHIM